MIQLEMTGLPPDLPPSILAAAVVSPVVRVTFCCFPKKHSEMCHQRFLGQLLMCPETRMKAIHNNFQLFC